IRDGHVTGVQTCALPIWSVWGSRTLFQHVAALQFSLCSNRMPDKLSDSSLCVHAGEDVRKKNVALTTPIVQTSVFALASLDEMRSEERRVGKEGGCEGGR